MNELSKAGFNAPVVLTELDDIFNAATIAAYEGITAGASYDRIVMQQGRFYLKTADGEDNLLQTVEIPVVMLNANPALCRRYFMRSWNPSQEATMPDCMSYDGKGPTHDSPNKQSASCIDCPNNVWGTGRDQSGNATKGKACHEYKQLAVYYNNRVYGLAVPRTSLGSWKEYVTLLTSNGRVLQKVVTTIGVKPSKDNTTMVMEFQFGGDLNEPQVRKIASVFDSNDVKKIIAPNVITSGAGDKAKPQEKTATAKPDIGAQVAAPMKNASMSIFGGDDDDDNVGGDPVDVASSTPADKSPKAPKGKTVEPEVVTQPVRQTAEKTPTPAVDAFDEDDDALAAELGL